MEKLGIQNHDEFCEKLVDIWIGCSKLEKCYREGKIVVEEQ